MTLSHKTDLTFRKPRLEDGHNIFDLVKSCEPLDLNSVYSYLLLCQHFADTCVVAEENSRIVGFLSGYVPPLKEDVFFVWQVAVDGKARGQGIGKTLLKESLKRTASQRCLYLETTITLSNQASWNLFRSFAKDIEAPSKKCLYFSERFFGQERHEAEYLFRIGPFDLNQVK